ncbi:AAA family ATPase [Paenibacillus sp. L3-i20]|uniref:AAA family ATPase n=1 Tax=Paenibacillus sp. L3-i20 TaxID=2905833 RepID=UPI001EDFF290|nr:AAA family ATPase [Paenibacillus sp. L3-i20]GKU78270.1 hypothetical protein L3i20_v226670 [Paenibacillus sp. L3-i20]
MRLVEAHIDGYGRLNNRRLDLDAPVIVVFGPNEAGKSTLFGFVRTMLFGFAKRSNIAERQESLLGGRHGGRLLFRHSSGTTYVVNRHADDAGGKPKVRIIDGNSDSSYLEDADEKIMEQAKWESQFLGGMNMRLYRQVYAITLTELNEVSALAVGELGQHLYQAGWDGGKAIVAAEKEIMQELDSLFKPKGSNQRMSSEWKTLEKLDAELRRIADGIDRFNELNDELESTEEALAEISEQLPSLVEHLHLLRKAVGSRPNWLRKCELQVNREKLVYTDHLSPGAEQSWHELLRQRAEINEQLNEVVAERALLERQRSVLQFDSELVAKGAETAAILQDAERMRSLTLQLAELETELQGLDESIGGLVTSISPEWTERQLRELTITVADRDYVRERRDRGQAMRRAEERLDLELETIQAHERELLQQLNASEERLHKTKARLDASGKGRFKLIPESKMALTTAWDKLDEALRNWELERAGTSGTGHSVNRTNSSNSRMMWAGLCGAGTALVLGAASASGLLGGMSSVAAITAIVIGGVSIALIAGMNKFGNKWTKGNGRSSQRARISSRGNRTIGSISEQHLYEALLELIEESEEMYRSFIDIATANQNQAASFVVSIRSSMRMEVQERLEAIDEYVRMMDECSEHRSRLNRARTQLKERAEAATTAAHNSQLEAEEWASWLSERALPKHMSPAAALEAFELAESAMQRLRQYDRLSARQVAAQKELAAYRDHSVMLCASYSNSALQPSTDPTLALQLLQGEIRRHAAIAAERDEITSRLDQLIFVLEGLETKEASIEQSLIALIEQAKLVDEEQYGAALADRSLLVQIDLELTKLQIELTAGLTEERLEQLEALFAQFDEEQLSEAFEKTQREEAKLIQQQFDRLEQKGRLSQAKEQLLQEDERQRLLIEREMTAAGLDINMERYAVLTISKALIDRTKRIYEEERQPAVLKKASQYFRTLTGGRYIRVSVNVEESGIRVENNDHTMLDSSVLSRGTAEQLYLAMRLALAVQSSQGEKLPLLLDDLFVNFDSERLQAAARLVAQLADERQLLLFTCHEKVRDELLAARSDALLVELSSTEAI